MNVELYMAKRFHFSENAQKNRMSRPAIRIATIGIAVGLAVMIVAVAVVIGFKNEVRDQVVGFGSHIQVSAYSNASAYDTPPIAPSDSLLAEIFALPNVAHVQKTITKTGILKTSSDFQGIVLKGVDKNFDWTFFKKNLTQGNLPAIGETVTNEALISQQIANGLRLQVGDKFMAYFVDKNIRARRFSVCGIYTTNFAEYDKLFIITDIQIPQKLNNWNDNEVSRLEIWTKDFEQVDATTNEIYFTTANRPDSNQTLYQTQSIKELVPQIFEWLNLLDMNAWIILVLMFAVAGFNMISGLLILILERTNTIGVLKALGVTDWNIRKLFLYQSVFLIGKGMMWGNLIGVGLVIIEYFFHVIPLDPLMYYVSYVPVTLNIGYWLLINIVVAIVSVGILILPSYLITKISPAKSIKFD